MFTIKDFLASEVRPAFGCTEPGAIALAVAHAWEAADKEALVGLHVCVSGSVFKNGAAVGIPGTNGLRGNAVAAALACVCGESSLGLEALSKVDTACVEKASALLAQGRVVIEADTTHTELFIEATLRTASHTSTCTIKQSHANVVRVTCDDAVLFEKKEKAGRAEAGAAVWEAMERMTFRELFELARSPDEEEIAILLEGIAMNKAVAASSASCADLTLNPGKLMQNMQDSATGTAFTAYAVRALASSAAEARMAGVRLPVMSSAGSGNHGITAILPVAVVGEQAHKSEKEIASALLLSHLTTSYVKTRVGRLSAVCGCAVAAGAGAAAGIVSLLGGSVTQAGQAVELLLANLMGMLCDGGKETCALKVGTAAQEAYHSALMALAGHVVDGMQGIVGSTIERTVTNAASINLDAMKDVDEVLIDLLNDCDCV